MKRFRFTAQQARDNFENVINSKYELIIKQIEEHSTYSRAITIDNFDVPVEVLQMLKEDGYEVNRGQKYNEQYLHINW